jgi:hypothetical protein
MSDVFGNTTDREASPANVARITAAVASDFRFTYFGTGAFCGGCCALIRSSRTASR